MTSSLGVRLFIVLVCSASMTFCQQQQSQLQKSQGQKELSTSLTDATTSSPSDKINETATTTTPKEVLFSGEEFVDFTETPMLLFDSTGENSSNSSTSSLPDVATFGNSSITSSSPLVPSKATNSTATITTREPINGTTITTTTESLPPATDSSDGEELEEEDESSDGSRGDTKAEFSPPQNVSQYMDYIERLFRDLRHQIKDLFEPHIPQLIRTSQMVQLSGSCSYDMLLLALALRRFEPWALRMIDSSGKVPEGIFEGSFTALGSYDECLSTVFAHPASSQVSSGQQQPSAASGGTSNQPSLNPTQGKYCLVNVSPFLPPKPPADRVERMFQEEANRRNYTKDDQFSRLSPMFYYMQFRIGVCIPSSCVDSDLESISSALSSSLRLNITIPHCRVAQSQPLTVAQLVGGLVFTLVVGTVVVATLVDYTRLKLNRLRVRNVLLAASDISAKSGDRVHANVILRTSAQVHKSGSSSSTNFSSESLEKHWTWMSFSLLTNYKLYFRHKPGPQTTMPETKAARQQMYTSNSMIVRCLNGIRVLSLCWVIVANSYITLDPRATKRLTKTREAPKDFLFQMVVQASLAIETFFFLSGILLSLSYSRKLNPRPPNNPNGKLPTHNTAQSQTNDRKSGSHLIRWIQFYVHRYVRMTPATMLVIAFTMFAFRYGDGPLWFEATHKAHLSCTQNWWRHLLHVANYIDTRQMCFIHYWYISADMQLFLFAPLLLFLLHRRRRIGYAIATLVGLGSMGSVFYTTYVRNLPPTLLFYNSDPESRREFGNTIMTKPLTHALPYLVGMLVGKWLAATQASRSTERVASRYQSNRSLATLFGLIATLVALSEVFLPYKWNNSQLPTRFLASVYAALFRLGWSLVLAYVVISCRHKRTNRCGLDESAASPSRLTCSACCANCGSLEHQKRFDKWVEHLHQAQPVYKQQFEKQIAREQQVAEELASSQEMCLCGSGGSLLNRLLSLSIFTHLSKLSFVAYLIHLPLMSVFIAQTRGLFAFSHTLVIHLALSYLVMTFVLSFLLVHLIEFPFITFERYLFDKLFYGGQPGGDGSTGTDLAARRARQVISKQQQFYGRPESYTLSHGSENLKLSERL